MPDTGDETGEHSSGLRIGEVDFILTIWISVKKGGLVVGVFSFDKVRQEMAEGVAMS